jgi:uncharacterized protein YbgA (DUF1722 family)
VSKKQAISNKKLERLSEKNILDFIINRFNIVKQKNRIRDLVSFQGMNKYMIMVHNQNELKILGNLVASNKKNQFPEILFEYEKHLKMALGKKPTIKTHSNVIMHIFGYFSKDFSQPEKEKFFNLLKQFTEKKITIGEILSEISPLIIKFDYTYLASQTYFLLYANVGSDNLFKNLAKKED